MTQHKEFQNCMMTGLWFTDMCFIFLIFFFFLLSRGRKMNSHLEAAIQEAMMELDHQNVSESDSKSFAINKGRTIKKRKTR